MPGVARRAERGPSARQLAGQQARSGARFPARPKRPFNSPETSIPRDPNRSWRDQKLGMPGRPAMGPAISRMTSPCAASSFFLASAWAAMTRSAHDLTFTGNQLRGFFVDDQARQGPGPLERQPHHAAAGVPLHLALGQFLLRRPAAFPALACACFTSARRDPSGWFSCSDSWAARIVVHAACGRPLSHAANIDDLAPWRGESPAPPGRRARPVGLGDGVGPRSRVLTLVSTCFSRPAAPFGGDQP